MSDQIARREQVREPVSYQPYFKLDGKWVGQPYYFPTHHDAYQWAQLHGQEQGATDCGSQSSEHPITHTFWSGLAVAIPQGQERLQARSRVAVRLEDILERLTLIREADTLTLSERTHEDFVEGWRRLQNAYGVLTAEIADEATQ